MTILLNGSEINKWMKQRTKVGIVTSVSRTVRFIFQKHVEIFGQTRLAEQNALRPVTDWSYSLHAF